MLKKIILCLILINSSQNLISSNLTNDLYGSPWEFIEDTFITKPERKYSRISNLLGSGILSSGVFYLGKKIYKNLAKNNKDYSINKDIYKKRELVIGLTSSLLTGVMSYKLLADRQKNNIEYDALRKFIASWQDNKPYTPQELHKSFDALARVYKNDKSVFNENYEDTVRLIKKAIYKKFPNKYKAEDLADDKKGFWDSKVLLGHVDFSFGGVLNSIANLIRAISGR